MKLNDVNQIKNSKKEYKLLDLYQMVASKDITPISNEKDDIIGFNFSKVATGIKVSKLIDGHMTVGNTEEERKADEQAYRDFVENFINKFGSMLVQKVIELSYKLVAANITPDDILLSKNRLIYIVLSDRKAYDQFGEEIVSLDDIEEKLSDKSVKNIILSRL